MSKNAEIREANKTLSHEPRGVVNFLLIPLNLARALRDVAVEWAKGVDEMGKSATKIDIGPSIRDWQTAQSLALEEKDRAIQQLRDLKPSDEAKRLKAELEKTIEALKLSKKSTFNAYLAGKREALEFHSIRGRVRRAAQRAGHAFLRGIS